MKYRYLRLVRRAHRSLRHPFIRRRPWLKALLAPLFAKNLWQPCLHSVARGFAIGVFCALLPIPFQTLIAALWCLSSRGNIPTGMATCWLTNPFTHPPIIVAQIELGHWIRQHVDIPIPFNRTRTIDFLGFTISGSPADFIVGVLLSACLLSLLAYVSVYAIYHFLPWRKLRFLHKNPSQ